MEDGNETSGGTQFSDARKLTNHTQHIETAITMHAYSSGGDNRGALHPQAPSPAQGKKPTGSKPGRHHNGMPVQWTPGMVPLCKPTFHPLSIN